MNLYLSFYMEEDKMYPFKDYCPKRISFYSDDDPYVPRKDAENFANQINSEKVMIDKAGHFNEKSGYTEFKELLKYI